MLSGRTVDELRFRNYTCLWSRSDGYTLRATADGGREKTIPKPASSKSLFSDPSLDQFMSTLCKSLGLTQKNLLNNEVVPKISLRLQIVLEKVIQRRHKSLQRFRLPYPTHILSNRSKKREKKEKTVSTYIFESRVYPRKVPS